MTLLATIKSAQLTARKNRDIIATALLTTLIGEASMPGKNDGNRESTDQEVVAVIKKFIKNANEVLKVSDNETSRTELSILESFLPKQLSEEELRSSIQSIVSVTEAVNGSKPKMGDVMKALKQKHDGQYDGGLASKLIKELL